MNRRFRVLKYWLKNNRNISPYEFLKFFFSPTCSFKAKKFILKIELDDDFYKIYFKKDFINISTPFFFPKDYPLHQLYQVVSEQMYSHDWHNYQHYWLKVSPEDIVVDCGASEGFFLF